MIIATLRIGNRCWFDGPKTRQRTATLIRHDPLLSQLEQVDSEPSCSKVGGSTCVDTGTTHLRQRAF